MKAEKKRIVIIAAAVLLTAAVGAGIWFGVRNSAEPVPVYPFHYIGMTEYWGDRQESYGPISTDRIQTVYLSDTQTVTEIHVKQGDNVKKGDPLITFDTTLTDIALERKRLDVEKKKLQLENAQERLREIRSMKPMELPDPDEEEEDEDKGALLTDRYRVSSNKEYDGSSRENALICWLHSGTEINDSLLEELRKKAENYRNSHSRQAETEMSVMPAGELPPDESEPEYTDPPYVDVDNYYVVFKMTKDNMSLGDRQVWQGMHVYGKGNGFRFTFFAPTIGDHMLDPDQEYEEEPSFDYGSGYTAAQLAQMRSEQEKKIKDLQFDIRMTEAEYRIMCTEASDGNIYSEIDGEVVSLLTEEEAKQQRQPLIKVSGGGGFYVEGSISELEKDKLPIGHEVTINDWNTGMTYTGKVTAVGDFPSQGDGWNGMGNPNATYYPFTVFVDESADLQAGAYTSIQYSTSDSQSGIYLENPFVRTEQGRYYVYVCGADGRLEKRQVTVGKSLWGSYKEILSGLTAEDLIAFPYGKELKEGARTEESDLSVLYGY